MPRLPAGLEYAWGYVRIAPFLHSRGLPRKRLLLPLPLVISARAMHCCIRYPVDYMNTISSRLCIGHHFKPIDNHSRVR